MPLHRLGHHILSGSVHKHRNHVQDHSEVISKLNIDIKKNHEEILQLKKDIDDKFKSPKCLTYVILYANDRKGEYFVLQNGKTWFKCFADAEVKVISKTKGVSIILDESTKTNEPDLKSATIIHQSSFLFKKNNRIYFSGEAKYPIVTELLFEHNV